MFYPSDLYYSPRDMAMADIIAATSDKTTQQMLLDHRSKLAALHHTSVPFGRGLSLLDHASSLMYSQAAVAANTGRVANGHTLTHLTASHLGTSSVSTALSSMSGSSLASTSSNTGGTVSGTGASSGGGVGSNVYRPPSAAAAATAPLPSSAAAAAAAAAMTSSGVNAFHAATSGPPPGHHHHHLMLDLGPVPPPPTHSPFYSSAILPFASPHHPSLRPGNLYHPTLLSGSWLSAAAAASPLTAASHFTLGSRADHHHLATNLTLHAHTHHHQHHHGGHQNQPMTNGNGTLVHSPSSGAVQSSPSTSSPSSHSSSSFVDLFQDHLQRIYQSAAAAAVVNGTTAPSKVYAPSSTPSCCTSDPSVSPLTHRPPPPPPSTSMHQHHHSQHSHHLSQQQQQFSCCPSASGPVHHHPVSGSLHPLPHLLLPPPPIPPIHPPPHSLPPIQLCPVASSPASIEITTATAATLHPPPPPSQPPLPLRPPSLPLSVSAVASGHTSIQSPLLTISSHIDCTQHSTNHHSSLHPSSSSSLQNSTAATPAATTTASAITRSSPSHPPSVLPSSPSSKVTSAYSYESSKAAAAAASASAAVASCNSSSLLFATAAGAASTAPPLFASGSNVAAAVVAAAAEAPNGVSTCAAAQVAGKDSIVPLATPAAKLPCQSVSPGSDCVTNATSQPDTSTTTTSSSSSTSTSPCSSSSTSLTSLVCASSSSSSPAPSTTTATTSITSASPASSSSSVASAPPVSAPSSCYSQCTVSSSLPSTAVVVKKQIFSSPDQLASANAAVTREHSQHREKCTNINKRVKVKKENVKIEPNDDTMHSTVVDTVRKSKKDTNESISVKKETTDAMIQCTQSDWSPVESSKKMSWSSSVRRRRFRSGLDMIRSNRKRQRPQAPSQIKSSQEGSANTSSSSSSLSLASSLSTSASRTEAKRVMVNKALGETLLHSAARKGYLTVVTDCLAKGTCSIDSRDNAGYTPLHECCSQGHFKIAKLLLSHGANLHICASGGRSALHEAIEADHISIVRLLLTYGADATLATYAGKTPLDLTCSKRMKLFLTNFLCDLNGPTTSDVYTGDTIDKSVSVTRHSPSPPLPPLARFSSPHLTAESSAAAPPRLVRFAREEEEEEEDEEETAGEEEEEEELRAQAHARLHPSADETRKRKRRKEEGEIECKVEERRRRRRKKSKLDDDDQPPAADCMGKSQLPVVIEELESDTHFIQVYKIKGNSASKVSKRNEQQLIEEDEDAPSGKRGERRESAEHFVLCRELHLRVKEKEVTQSHRRVGTNVPALAAMKDHAHSDTTTTSPAAAGQKVRMSDLKSVIVGYGVARGLGYEGYFSKKVENILPLSEARRMLPSTVEEFV